jgi:hypothetical protein
MHGFHDNNSIFPEREDEKERKVKKKGGGRKKTFA